MIIRTTIFVLGTILPCAAFSENYSCAGVLPSWSLELGKTSGTLTTDQTIEMPVLDITNAEGRDWPRAFTLVGDRDTAIVIITPRACKINDIEQPFGVLTLTQKGTTPILLDGCCEVAE